MVLSKTFQERMYNFIADSSTFLVGEGPRSFSRKESMANIAQRIASTSARFSPPQSQSASSNRPSSSQVLKAPANLLRRPSNLRLRSPSSLQRSSADRHSQGRVALERYAADAIRANRRGRGPEARSRRRTRSSSRRFSEVEENQDPEMESDFLDLVGEKRPKHENKAYTPVPIELEHLKETWPALPLNSKSDSSSASLSAVTSQLDWLARRFPTGFTTHHELALRLLNNELVSFDSEAEKEAVVALAKKMASQRAEQKTEEKGKAIQPKPIDFEGLPKDQGKDLMDVFVRGQYKKVEDQRIPLLDQVARQLWNNGSFQDEKTRRVLSKIETLIPQQQQKQAGAAAAGAAGNGSQKGGKRTQKATA